MDNLNVIDSFMAAFIGYIDSGFGLLGPDVHFLTATLIALDVTLAGLFWALSGEGDVIAKFIRKILYIGSFAFILNSFSSLATIIFSSFARAGLTAGGGTISAEDLLRPGRLASTGFAAAWPLLNQAGQLVGFTTFFDNILTIAVLLFAWAIVIVAFFVIAVQLFVTILEFKLTCLAGFILVPFALWNRTNFLAERVLGNVVASGVKVMVLAVIVGIGSQYFDQFTSAVQGQQPDIGQAMSLVLASLALFGLGIFGPGIASGLVAGAPQLGAGAAVGTAVGAAGLSMVGAGAARATAGAALGAVRAGTSIGAGATTAYRLGQEGAGSPSIGAGMSGIARAAGGAARLSIADRFGLGDAAAGGRAAADAALGGTPGTSPAPVPPAWARKLRAEQAARHHRHLAVQALREGDRGGASATPDLKERGE